jgi:hypothetical protein
MDVACGRRSEVVVGKVHAKKVVEAYFYLSICVVEYGYWIAVMECAQGAVLSPDIVFSRKW